MAVCRFGPDGCIDRPVVCVALSEGCICFPDDREQLLCLHHAMRSTPLGTIEALYLVDDSPFVERVLGERFTLSRPR